ncbi:MAG: ABC transporter permease [Bacteroidetes bacterium]|nr:MAG: ABC transporter permease [Bacteroidota bacterium]
MSESKINFNQKINWPWIFQMAWRDSRKSRSRLILFISSIILGIAALVGIFSFGYNLKSDIDQQAKQLVGADLVVESFRPLSPTAVAMLDSLGTKRSRERTFASMVYFVKSQGTRLVQVRALEGDYPYYGDFETMPVSAARSFRNSRSALVDKTLMLQYEANVGDSIRIGELNFVIAGSLDKAPGRTGLSTTIAPPIYIPLQYLEKTGLVQKGSRIGFTYYYLFAPGTDLEEKFKSIEPRLDKEGLEYETVESRKRNTGRAFDDFTQFLTLISFIALLLGCIGVASAIHIYVREKINSIAILRCLGANSTQAFLIYLIQVAGIGLIGSIIGAMLGILVQEILPIVLKDFLPVETSLKISWISIGQGILLGLIISVLFALLPLISIRKISPLFTLRVTIEPVKFFNDRLAWILCALIFAFVLVFSKWQMHSWNQAMVFTLGIGVAFLLLTFAAITLMWAARKFFPFLGNYLWRQAFSNLYRPNNQTIILIVTIGLGTAFIGTLYFIQSLLLNRVSLSAQGNQPNTVLFDIQTAQKEKIAEMTRKFGLPVIQQVPIVTIRFEKVNGRTAAQIKADSNSRVPARVFDSEIRVTYRDTLTETEKIVKGQLHGKVNSSADPIYISIDENYANHIHLKIGDSILFNVQGAMINTIVGSFRQVDWRRVQTNFRIVFPTGVLEAAPQFHVLVTRVPNSETSAKFQRTIVKSFPNVSIIDLGLILRVLDDILGKIGFVIRFMAAFSIITGLIVLIASVLISKFQRMQESVLLRTLGATTRQIFWITALEYFFLGALASCSGILFSFISSWGLAKFIFDTKFSPQWVPSVSIIIIISILTVLIGVLNSRSVVNKPPLEILRKEI